jgi:hypothetical protein
MVKVLKKKDMTGAVKVYNEALVALDNYLAKVELPAVSEI